jgi:predicted enzyme related to lactoylglutathione lyase
MESNMVGWFEIPVQDMDRAKKFYDAVFDIDIQVQNFNELLMGWFPFAENKMGSSGSLVQHATNYQPSETKGPLLYFSCKDLGKIEAAGGRIIQSKTLISDDVGYMAVFIDTEGNRIALHSRS